MFASRPQLANDRSSASPEGARALVNGLFRDNYAGLCSFAKHYVGSRATAEDVVQEMFLRLWERLEAGDLRAIDATGKAAVTSAYLYAATRSHAISVVRHQQVERRHSDSEILTFDSPERTSHDDAVESELTLSVRRAILALPHRARLVFLMSRDNGLTHCEIAAVLGISIKAVESNMTRALKALRAALSGAIAGSVMLGLHGLIHR